VEVIVTGGEWYCDEKRPQGYQVEGPVDLIAERTVETRRLRIAGHVGKIKTSCTMNAINRAEAVKTLSAWSEKERERLQKKVMLGALSADAKRAMRRAKYDEDGDGMVEVLCAMPDSPAKCVTCGRGPMGMNCKSLGHTITKPVENPKVLKMGTPIELGVMAPLKFVVVRWGSAEDDGKISFTVTETITGKSTGSGDTAEKAIVAARQVIAEISPERMKATVEQVLASQINQAMVEAQRLSA
jgi:hypothetical protein